MLTKIISLFFLIELTELCLFIHFQPRPCAADDLQCWSEAFEAFFAATAPGVPDLNIKPTDPLILDSVSSNIFDSALMHFKNVNVTGLKEEKLTEFKMDIVAKKIEFTVTMDVDIASDVEIEYMETKKKFTGTHTARGNAVVTVAFDYTVTPNDKGVEYYESGSETVTCNFTTLKVDVNQELLDSIANDPHAHKLQKDNAANIDTSQKTHECSILKAAYAVVMEGSRAVERAYPSSSIFTNA